MHTKQRMQQQPPATNAIYSRSASACTPQTRRAGSEAASWARAAAVNGYFVEWSLLVLHGGGGGVQAPPSKGSKPPAQRTKQNKPKQRAPHLEAHRQRQGVVPVACLKVVGVAVAGRQRGRVQELDLVRVDVVVPVFFLRVVGGVGEMMS
jgi:hypothetical protein